MIDAPRGYYFGSASGRELRHLVKIEEWNTTALCGVQVFHPSLVTEGHDGSRICKDCQALHAEPTSVLISGRPVLLLVGLNRLRVQAGLEPLRRMGGEEPQDFKARVRIAKREFLKAHPELGLE